MWALGADREGHAKSDCGLELGVLLSDLGECYGLRVGDGRRSWKAEKSQTMREFTDSWRYPEIPHYKSRMNPLTSHPLYP